MSILTEATKISIIFPLNIFINVWLCIFLIDRKKSVVINEKAFWKSQIQHRMHSPLGIWSRIILENTVFYKTEVFNASAPSTFMPHSMFRMFMPPSPTCFDEASHIITYILTIHNDVSSIALSIKSILKIPYCFTYFLHSSICSTYFCFLYWIGHCTYANKTLYHSQL